MKTMKMTKLIFNELLLRNFHIHPMHVQQNSNVSSIFCNEYEECITFQCGFLVGCDSKYEPMRIFQD